MRRHVGVFVLILGVLAISNTPIHGKPREGFQSTDFIKARAKVDSLDTKAGEFCRNGAAFVLAGQEGYAKQYYKHFKPCIDALMMRVRNSKL